MKHRLEIDQTEHGAHDDGCQDGLGQMVEIIGEQHHHEDNTECTDDGVHTRAGADACRHGRSGKRTADDIGLEETADDVRQTLPDQLLIRIQFFARLGGKRT